MPTLADLIQGQKGSETLQYLAARNEVEIKNAETQSRLEHQNITISDRERETGTGKYVRIRGRIHQVYGVVIQ